MEKEDASARELPERANCKVPPGLPCAVTPGGCESRKDAHPRRRQLAPQLFARGFLSAGFPRTFAKEDRVQGKYSRSDRGKSKAGNGEGQRELIVVHGQDSACVVYFENSDSHLGREQQARSTRKESDHEQHSTKGFQYPGNINEISRKAVLGEESEHRGHGFGDFRIAVREKNDAESKAQEEQGNGLEGGQEPHGCSGNRG